MKAEVDAHRSRKDTLREKFNLDIDSLEVGEAVVIADFKENIKLPGNVRRQIGSTFFLVLLYLLEQRQQER